LAILVDISKSKIRYKTPKMPERNDCNFLNIEIQDMTSRPKLISIVSGIQLNDQNLINPNIFSENSNIKEKTLREIIKILVGKAEFLKAEYFLKKIEFIYN
jgi:hypothetical protein